VFYTVFLYERIERVNGPGVVMVQPGTENVIPSEIPPMLVRNDIVRIVPAEAGKAERPEGQTG